MVLRVRAHDPVRACVRCAWRCWSRAAAEGSAGREHGSWTRFDASGEAAVEAAHAAGSTTAQSSFFNPRMSQTVVYHYDLSRMEQVLLFMTLQAARGR